MNTLNPFGVGGDDDMIDIPDASGASSSYHAPPGAYSAEVVDVSNAPSKDGKKMLTFEFAVDVGKRSPLSIKYRVMPDLASTMWRLDQLCKALGIQPGKVSKSAIITRRCTVILQDHEYNGQKNSEIAKCEPPKQDDDIQF